MKIDIVDLMDFYWNDAPVPDAPEKTEELLKQGGTWVPRREAGRRRNRPLLAAAAMLLAVLAAVPFVLSRIAGDPDAASTENAQSAEASDNYQTAYPDDDPAAVSAENVESAETSDDYQTAHPAGTLLSSAVYPVALEAPAEYTAEIEVDTPYQGSTVFDNEIQFDNVVFSFYDKSSHAYGRPGLVWCITATPKNEYMLLDPIDEGFVFEYNQAKLGTDEDYVYTLIYPCVSSQCNPHDPENAGSYYAHLAIGQDLLTQFIQQNSLHSDGAGLELYAAYLASFDYQTAHPAGTLLTSAVYPVTLEAPAEYTAEIEVDTPYLDTWLVEIQFDNVVFSFYDKSSQAYGGIGLVWCITATPKNEYTPLDPAEYEGFIFEYNQAELGTDEDYVYTLIYPNAGHHYYDKDRENTNSYFAHLVIGQDLLTQFVQQNSLQTDSAGVELYAAYLAWLQKKLVK